MKIFLKFGGSGLIGLIISLSFLVTLNCSEEANPFRSIELNGMAYIEISNSVSLQEINAGKLTVEIWAAAGSGTDDKIQALFMIGDNNGRDELALFKGLGDSLLLCFVDNRNLPPTYLPEVDLTSGEFHYYALVVEALKVNFYFDGNLVQQTSFSELDIDIGSSNALIGADYDAANEDVGNFWEGSFDEVRLWSRALTKNEVLFHYEHPDKLTEHYSENGLNDLIGIWRFNQASGSIIPDGSGNGNDGVIMPAGTGITWSHSGFGK